MQKTLRGKDVATGTSVEVAFSETIGAARPAPGSDEAFLSPGWIDVQVNGFAGVDYNSAGTSHEEIARSAYEFQLRVERGETVLVGVNKFADGAESPVIASPDYSALEREQVGRVRAVRTSRDASVVQGALDVLAHEAAEYTRESATPRAHLMPLIIDAVRARASVGEISDVLSDAWGTYRPGA